VDGNPYEMVVSPGGIAEISYDSDVMGDFAAVYSDEGSTRVTLGYASEPINLPEGEGERFYFENPQVAQSTCNAHSSGMAMLDNRKAPSPDGGLTAYMVVLVLLILRRRRSVPVS